MILIGSKVWKLERNCVDINELLFCSMTCAFLLFLCVFVVQLLWHHSSIRGKLHSGGISRAIRCKCVISALLSELPASTKWRFSALLPHIRLSFQRLIITNWNCTASRGCFVVGAVSRTAHAAICCGACADGCQCRFTGTRTAPTSTCSWRCDARSHWYDFQKPNPFLSAFTGYSPSAFAFVVVASGNERKAEGS